MSGKRMLHKNICISKKLSKISYEAECLYYRILVNCDDEGRFHANPHTVKDSCMPIRVTNPERIRIVLDELENNRLIHRYVVDNVDYLEVVRFSDFQILRSDVKKRVDYPKRRNESVTDTERIRIAEVKDKDKDKDKVAIPANAGTPQAELVESWKALYQAKTGQPYNATARDYVLTAKLLKKFSADQVIEKAKLLFEFCQRGDVWFAKSMADFTIGKLSSMWNQIIKEVQNGAGISEGELASFMSGRE